MHGPGKWLALGATLLGICVTVFSVFAQSPSVCTPEQVATLFEKARPILEETLSVRLEQPPHFRLATAPEWQELHDPLMQPQLHWQFPGLEGESMNRAVEGAETVWRQTLGVWVRESSNTVYLFPDQLPRMAGAESVSEGSASADFLQLVLVQEMTRLVLEQRHGLTRKLTSCRDEEEFQALQAVSEGRNLWVTRQAARRLGTEKAFAQLTKRYQQAPDHAPDSYIRAVVQKMLQQRQWACVQGLAFFDALEQKNFRDLEKRVFGHPPRKVLWINQPELYWRAEQANRVDLTETLATIEKALPGSAWTATQQPWTPEMVRQVSGLLGEKERTEHVLRSWDEAHSLIWSARDNPSHQVAVGVARFVDAGGARAYQGLAIDLQRKQDELLGSGRGGTCKLVGSPTSTTLRLAGAEEAVRLDKCLQIAAGGSESQWTVSELLVRTGNLVIEFSWQGTPADPAWAERILADIQAKEGK